MKSVGEIVRERREAMGLTLAALAEEVGLTKGYLSMIENHRVENPPSRAALESIERALGIVDGELLRAADWQNTPEEVRQRVERMADEARRGRELAEWLRRQAERRRDGSKNLDKLYRSGELTRRIHDALGDEARGAAAAEKRDRSLDAYVPVRYQVPLINKMAAGYPSDFTDLGYPARVADDYVPCPDVGDPNAFAATVVGESMQPEYHEGDIVVFSPRLVVTDGSDCFIRLEPDHQTTFKRVFFEGAKNVEEVEKLRLQPLNPRFAPLTVGREQVAGLYKAVWRLQKLR